VRWCSDELAKNVEQLLMVETRPAVGRHGSPEVSNDRREEFLTFRHACIRVSFMHFHD
jgi:hypothetical protein